MCHDQDIDSEEESDIKLTATMEMIISWNPDFPTRELVDSMHPVLLNMKLDGLEKQINWVWGDLHCEFEKLSSTCPTAAVCLTLNSEAYKNTLNLISMLRITSGMAKTQTLTAKAAEEDTIQYSEEGEAFREETIQKAVTKTQEELEVALVTARNLEICHGQCNLHIDEMRGLARIIRDSLILIKFQARSIANRGLAYEVHMGSLLEYEIASIPKQDYLVKMGVLQKKQNALSLLDLNQMSNDIGTVFASHAECNLAKLSIFKRTLKKLDRKLSTLSKMRDKFITTKDKLEDEIKTRWGDAIEIISDDKQIKIQNLAFIYTPSAKSKPKPVKLPSSKRKRIELVLKKAAKTRFLKY